jgi:transcriptional regulator with XRE-family HTH domain
MKRCNGREPNQPFRDALGARISLRRQRLKLTQRELSRRVGVEDSFIYNLERGRTGVRLETLLFLAAALDVKPDWFLKGIANDYP